MDIIHRINDTLEAWEHSPDAARWTPAEIPTSLPFSDPSWRHTAICRECTAEGRFATEDNRDEWMRNHETLWRHRDWRTQSFHGEA